MERWLRQAGIELRGVSLTVTDLQSAPFRCPINSAYWTLVVDMTMAPYVLVIKRMGPSAETNQPRVVTRNTSVLALVSEWRGFEPMNSASKQVRY